MMGSGDPASARREDVDAAVLGVRRSALGRIWRSRCVGQGEALALALAQTHGLPDALSRVLAGRDVQLADAAGFLEPKLRDLMPDPSVLRDMDAAAARIATAIQRRERVAIFGDYDVDGACSSALLGDFLAFCGVPCAVHIPDRITEGYGPNSQAIEFLRSEGASLLVTVDCGTASHEAFETARRVGFDVVVLDHHQAPETLPHTLALVNPNRQDDLSGLGYLCAAGVVLLALVAVNRILREAGYWQGRQPPDLLAGLDLVALATVADVAPLLGLNRAFVRQGLQVMRQRRRPGLTALLDVANLKGPPAAWHMGFLVGPRINAGGRIGDAALGARLMMTSDAAEAARIAMELDELNRQRQAIEQLAVEEAGAEADRQLMANPVQGALALASAEWHPGVVGLIASRLKERFARPAFAFAVREDGVATGSGRSVPGIDLGRLVRRAVDDGVAVKGGGHAMAAGVTLAPGKLPEFSAFVEMALADQDVGAHAAELLLDGSLAAGGAQPELVAMLERAGPYGSGNPEPTFALPRHRLVEVKPVGAAHLRYRLKAGDGAQIGGVAFRAVGQPLGDALLAHEGQQVHAAGSLTINSWGGRDRAELRLVDLAAVREG